jgi:class 3 adenylate cyclase/tetratricopeptide (TPR) repeat protein
MRCPKCRFENREGAKFCLQCGTSLESTCPHCFKPLPPQARFCDDCGHKLDEFLPKAQFISTPESERKHVTVLFSDLSGYTAMAEKLDPEEVKEIMGRVFGEISKVVGRYEGFVEKFIGDAVMALFGAPTAHEDDPVRAIKAAREIHDVISSISPSYEERIGRSLAMHTGISTGLVVTGDVNLEKGTHGVLGDTINVASRLSGLAKPGDIVISSETYRQTEGYFTFEPLEATGVKGKTGLVKAYRVLSSRKDPTKMHRISGLRAELIGRKAEMAQLREALQNLQRGKGSIFSIAGDAGTGKSRLIEEFRATVGSQDIQWREGHCYAYAQNIPYFPLIDLLNRAWQIEEGDTSEIVRRKVESGITDLIGNERGVIPYLGTLYSLGYPEIEGVSPELWKTRLYAGVQSILSALTRRGPTVICLEDLHWADTASLDLFRFILSGSGHSFVFLCVYRPPFNLFSGPQLTATGMSYRQIQLHDLSPSEAQNMTESLLKSKSIPAQLRRFIHEKVEGNPFYLEEVINSLIETETLIHDNGGWRLAGPIRESDVPPTMHGLISARLDRLQKEKKRILQEASVIGRVFPYKILSATTEFKKELDQYLSDLESLDLIRTRSPGPDLEYFFKHALTHEAVYNGLLKKDRQRIHERIALAMEQLFGDRILEICEVLAFHFKRGLSITKTIDYLVKSGEKSLQRYAVEESHQYFQEAFELLSKAASHFGEEQRLLIEVLIKWAPVFYYRGDFKGLNELFSNYETAARTIADKSSLGIFLAWLGFAVLVRNRPRDSYKYLRTALDLGEQISNQKVIGYACTWLSYTCSDLGLLVEATAFGKRAQEISRSMRSDHYLYFKSLAGIGQTCFFTGDRKTAIEIGTTLVEFGEKQSNIRSTVLGHTNRGFGQFLAGDFPSAIACFRRAVQAAADPFYVQYPAFFLGLSLLLDGKINEAESALQELSNFSDIFGAEGMALPAQAYLGVVSITKGQLKPGLRMLEQSMRAAKENGRKFLYALLEYTLAKIYLQLIERAGPIRLSFLIKNVFFILRNLPLASNRSQEHFTKAIQVSREIGASGILGQAFLDLGRLHRVRGRTAQARECLIEAIQIFDRTEARFYLKQAHEALQSLGS